MRQVRSSMVAYFPVTLTPTVIALTIYLGQSSSSLFSDGAVLGTVAVARVIRPVSCRRSGAQTKTIGFETVVAQAAKGLGN
jgi:hypothetical protein